MKPPIYGFLRYDEQVHGPRLGPHVDATWTYPEHFAHDLYQRGHLPQLCITASGWKARVLAWIFRARVPDEVSRRRVCEACGLLWFDDPAEPFDGFCSDRCRNL